MRIVEVTSAIALAVAAAACTDTDRNTVSTDANLIEGDNAANAALGTDTNNAAVNEGNATANEQ